VLYCLALMPVSLLPVLHQKAGWIYGLGAVALGLLFLAAAIGFSANHTNARARRVLRASLVYLPALLALMLLEAFVTGKMQG